MFVLKYFKQVMAQDYTQLGQGEIFTLLYVLKKPWIFVLYFFKSEKILFDYVLKEYQNIR